MSVVAVWLSFCLSGFIRTAGKEYVIEPLAGTDTGDHAVFKYSNLRQVPLHCGVNNVSIHHALPSFAVRERSRTTVRMFRLIYLIIAITWHNYEV